MAFRDIKDHPDMIGDATRTKWQYSRRMCFSKAHKVVRGEAMYWVQCSQQFDWICSNLNINASFLRGCALTKEGRNKIINSFARFESARKYHEKDYQPEKESSQEEDDYDF